MRSGGTMNQRRLYDVVMDITSRLENKEKDYEDYVKWLMDMDLTEAEARSLLDKLLKRVEEAK
jgi:hypothetical protein